MTALNLRLPLPPGINGSGGRRGGYAIATVRGMPRLVLSRTAREWRQEAELAVMVQAREQDWRYRGGAMTVQVTRSDGHDLDSGIKLLLDAVCAAIRADDARIAHLAIERVPGACHDGQLRLTVAERGQGA